MPQALDWPRKVENQAIKTESGCLLWSPRGNPGYYGKTRVNGKQKNAHRVALEYKLGRSLLPGMIACHTCDVKNCVNPDHLYEGTPRQNTRDTFNRGLAPRQDGTHNPAAKLTEEDVKIIRFLSENGIKHQAIAGILRETSSLKICRELVSMIVRRARWAHVS